MKCARDTVISRESHGGLETSRVGSTRSPLRRRRGTRGLLDDGDFAQPANQATFAAAPAAQKALAAASGPAPRIATMTAVS